MKRVRLFHWQPQEGSLLAETLRAAKFAVDYEPSFAPGILRAMRQQPPDAAIIDLTRLPSHGREVAIAMRGSKQMRHIPILFVGGAPEKVAAVREKLPDAAYCDQAHVLTALRTCIKQRTENPVVPPQMMERYATRTTAQKLGIGPGAKVAVINAPRDYTHVIGALPDNTEFDEESWNGCAVTVWFVEDPEAYIAALPKMRRAAEQSKLWVAWPKKTARRNSLLSENLIREMAIENGLVDYKVCSINLTWSGLCLALRKTNTTKRG